MEEKIPTKKEAAVLAKLAEIMAELMIMTGLDVPKNKALLIVSGMLDTGSESFTIVYKFIDDEEGQVN